MSPYKRSKMGRGELALTARAEPRRPLRLTRLRSQLAGAPAVMHGLDSKNRTTEALPPDPEDMSMAEVRHRLPRSHPLSKRRIRIILHPNKKRRSPSPEIQAPPRRPLIRLRVRPRPEGHAMTGGPQGNPAVGSESPEYATLVHIPEPTPEPALPVVKIELDPADSVGSPAAVDPELSTIKEESGPYPIKEEPDPVPIEEDLDNFGVKQEPDDEPVYAA